MKTVVGVDAGGTVIKAAVYGAAWDVLAATQRPTPQPAAADAVLDAVVSIASGVCEQAGVRATAIGVAVPGIVDEDTGFVRLAANLGFRDTPVRDLVRDAAAVGVTVVNDAWAACLAEWRQGAARGVDDVLMITLGTGIGGAAIAGGRRVRGSSGAAGELGHIVVSPDGEPCGCGARGCLETIASARAVARRYAAIAGGETSADAAEVVKKAIAGDRAAGRVWMEAVAGLASALATCVTVLDPALIVVGGGMAAAGEALVEPLRHQLHRRLTLRKPPRVVTALHGSTAGRLGAALSASASEL